MTTARRRKGKPNPITEREHYVKYRTDKAEREATKSPASKKKLPMSKRKGRSKDDIKGIYKTGKSSFSQFGPRGKRIKKTK